MSILAISVNGTDTIQTQQKWPGARDTPTLGFPWT
jgi:hypothetical protein